MSQAQPTQSATQSEELDKIRGVMLVCAYGETKDEIIHASARINANQPLAVSLLKGIMNRLYQLKNTRYYDPKVGLTIDGKIIIKPKSDEKFDPRFHYYINVNLTDPLAKEVINNFLSSTKGVEAQRTKLVLETVKDIGRPNTNILGQLQGLNQGRESTLEESSDFND